MATIAQTNLRIENATRVNQFVSLARAIALGRDQHGRALLVAREAHLKGLDAILANPIRVYGMAPDLADRQKAAILAGGTVVGDWSEPLAAYQSLASAFLESLRSYGAFDAMLGSMRRVPMRVRVGATVTAATGSAVGQGAVKPVSRLTLSGGTIDERKCVCQLIVTAELAEFSQPAAGNLFGVELSNAVAVATDQEFISLLISGAVSNPSSGSTAEGVRNDLRVALAAITTNARSKLFLLVPSAIAKSLAVLHGTTGEAAFPTMGVGGGTIADIQVVVSDGVPAATMVLVDAQQVAAASEAVTLDASNETTVQMNDAPDSPPTGATTMVSLFQTNQVVLRATRYFGATRLTTTGVAVTTGVSVIGDSPGP